MSGDLYFYAQYKRVSHVGGVQRFKRHPDDLNQALHSVRLAVAADSELAGRANPPTPSTAAVVSPTPNRPQQLFWKHTNDLLLQKIQQKFQASFVPDLLFKELDRYFQRLDGHDSTRMTSTATTKASSSRPVKAGQREESEHDPDESMRVEEIDDEQELIAKAMNRPRISLPASLILQLHSTWPDLIEEVQYKYPIWRTKAGEDEWNRTVEKRRLEKINAEKQRALLNSKQGLIQRNTSRTSINSIKYSTMAPRRPTITGASQMRSNRSLSRVSFSALDPARLLKTLPQNSSESLIDIPKGGLHFEFKFSSQTDPIKRQQPDFNQPKGVIIDTKSAVLESVEDQLIAIQKRCKTLLSDIREKISYEEKGFLPDKFTLRLSKLWFYGDNQQIRNRTNLMTFNEAAKRQRSKFTFSILRHELPEKYNIEIEFPTSKRKSLLEFDDGSGQIYYPSGRLAVLRLRSEKCELLFFDDVEPVERSFLGFMMADFGAVLMQPSFYPRLINGDQFEHVYLCSARNGEIEKEVQWHAKTVGRESAISTISGAVSPDEDILPPLFDNTIQFQINASMQLEISHAKNIRFAFAHDQEELRYHLTVPTSSSTVTPTPLKKASSKTKYASNSSNSNESSSKQQIQIERLLDGQINQKDLPSFKDLLAIKKRVRTICNLWLKACRTTLGVLDIDSYCLPDMPSSERRHLVSAIKPTVKIPVANRSKSAKPPRHVTISSRTEIMNKEFPETAEKEMILRTSSAKRVPDDVLEITLKEFMPQSDIAKALQKRMMRRRIMSPMILPSIGHEGKRSVRDELHSNRTGVQGEIPFVCPVLMRQRLIKDIRIGSGFDICSCRVDRLPVIHDLELDAFISKTNQFNPKQLLVIGIVNSNLHQLDTNLNESSETDARKSRELFEILENFHRDRQYGRSPMSLCRLSTADDYRCLVYDLAEATKQSPMTGPLLVRRHHVQPGFLLIFQHGQLIFGDSIFNGYGRNSIDLEKQLKNIQKPQIPLPDQFKFISDHRPTNKTVLKSV